MGISEEKCYLITENAKNNNMKYARRYLGDKLGWDNEQIMDFFGKMQHDIPNVRMSNCKYFLGVTRIITERQLTNGENIIKLNSILKYINNDESLNSSFDRNLNGLTFEKLSEQTTEGMEQAYKSERERFSSTDFGERNTSYNIVKINTFKEASEYGIYTSWCVTHEEQAFNNYTNNGICLFYFCLKDGFESVPQKEGEGCPLDEYGLSMLAVCVDENGECKTVTCRWNHSNGGNDNIMSTEELSELLGTNFYEVFKPSTVFRDKIKKATSLAQKGDFSGFDNISDFDENGFARVELNGKMNLMNKNCKLLFKQWFGYISNFDENGIATLKLNEKWNTVDTNGKLLSQQWFDDMDNFDKNGIAIVDLNDKYNLMDTNGNLISEQWFDNISNFDKNGIARVKLNNKMNLIDTNGKLLSQQWFDDIGNFENGFTKVYLIDKYNLMDTNGNLISRQWFDLVDNFVNGFVKVKLNTKWNFVDANGKLLSQQWFDDIGYFANGFVKVKLNTKWNFVGTNGNFLSRQWFDLVDNFDKNDIAQVELDYNYNFIDTNGKLLSQQWFDDIGCFDENGFAKVRLNNKLNFVDTNGKLLSQQWFDDMDNFDKNGIAIVDLNDKWNLINTNGNFLSKQWFDSYDEACDYLINLQ